MFFLRLALKSLLNRKVAVILTVVSIAISISLLLGVERIRRGVKESFTGTLYGTDLIVGARTGSEQLLMASIFHIGSTSNNLKWSTYQELDQNPLIDWTIPISMGDSHMGYAVIGANPDYFKHYRYGQNKELRLANGQLFNKILQTVIGSEIADKLNYNIGDEIVLNHGSGEISFHEHEELPFIITGILEPTGTPVDQTIHVDLQSIEAIHLGWKDGVPLHRHDDHFHFSPEELNMLNLEPKNISAFLVGLKSRTDVLQLQRSINIYEDEALTALMPGITFLNLWSLMSKFEIALLVISAFVALAGFTGMLVSLLTGIGQRRREMAILRSLGSNSRKVSGLIVGETLLITMASLLLGFALLFAIQQFASPILNTQLGLDLSIKGVSATEIAIVAIVMGVGGIVGFIPAYRLYRYSLHDGMTVRM